jgi:hypothetical protein
MRFFVRQERIRISETSENPMWKGGSYEMPKKGKGKKKGGGGC